MVSQRWRLTATCIIAADGTGTAVLLPQAAGSYQITLMSVSCSTSSTPASRASIYRDVQAPSNYVEGTNNGDGDSSNTQLELSTGESLVVGWVGAAPGASALFRVEGRYSADGTF